MGLAEALGPLTPQTRTLPAKTAKGPARMARVKDGSGWPVGRLDAQTPKRPDAPTPKRSAVSTAERLGLPLQGTAKSRHPEFAKKTLYVRKTTMRDAMRRYEDAGGAEESELVELLLQRYVSGRLDV